MNCTRCGSPSRVVDTRQPDAAGGVYNGRIRKAGEVASWYTSDIVVRRRVCSEKHEWFTVELTTEDVTSMVKDGQP